MTWKPALEGADREAAEAAIDAIGEALRREPPTGLGVAGGISGAALFFAHRGVARGDHDDWDHSWELLDEAIGGLASADLPVSLYSGIAGIAWALAHLAALGEDGDGDGDAGGDEGGDDNEFADVDDLLLRLVSIEPWTVDYDLISGLAGLMVYGLVRLPDEAGQMMCARLVELADATAERAGGEVRWFTRVELLPPWQAEVAPDGYYNAGVAHGIPGMIAALAQIEAAGIGGGKARELVDGAVAWLGRYSETARVPSWVYPNGEPVKSRDAWCYGDPGIAGALMCAASVLGDDALADRAIAVGRRAAAVPIEDTGIADPGLCHGAVGNAHIFNRLWQATGDEAMLDAARRCYRRGFELLRPGELFAGVGRWEPQVGGMTPAPGFLEGAAGVGLGLLAAISEHEPIWDQLMLLSPIRG